MNTLAVLSLLSFVIYLYIGIYVYKFNSKSDFNAVTSILCVNMAVWSFSFAFVYMTVGYKQAIWQIIAALASCYVYAIALHSLMLFIDNKSIKNPIFKSFIYIPGFIFLLIKIVSLKVYRMEKLFRYGMLLYGLIYSIISFILLYRWLKEAKTLREKKQGRIIITTGTISYFLMQISQVYSQIYDLPNIEQLFNLVLIIGILYTSVKYGLFEISPKHIINEVLGEMMDIVIVISPKGKILKVNKHMEYLTGYDSYDLLNMPYNVFLEDKDIINNIINENNNLNIQEYSQLQGHSQLNCIAKDGEKIPIRASYSSIIDYNLNELLGIIIVGHDIRETKRLEQEILEHKKSEEKLKESEERFRLMFYKNTAVMYLVNPETLDIFDINESAVNFYGYSKDEIRKMKITDLNGLSYDESKEIIFQIMSKDKKCYNLKHKLSNGKIRDVEIYSTLIPIKNKQMLCSIVIDITERKKAEKYISFLAYHDNLTGLPNRKMFYEKLIQEIKNSQINNKQFAVLYIDLDGFKSVNDTFGHAVGDFLLYEVGRRIKSCIRKEDILARMGGDEFTLLISDIQGYEDAQIISKKILKIFNDPIIKDGQEIFVQASIGISIYPEHGEDIKTLLEIADFNMYKHKSQKNYYN